MEINKYKLSAILCLVFLVVGHIKGQNPGDLTLWYNKDAGTVFTDALPIGNGHLGGMVYGIVSRDVIGLNECTVWSGNPGNNNKAGAANSLSTARSQIFAGNYAAADATVSNMIGGGQERFLPVGNLYLNFPGHIASNYYRELNLRTAIAKTTYSYAGVNYSREYFASYPDQIIVIRLTASQPGKITFSTSMDSPQTPVSISNVGNDLLLLNGQADAVKFQNRVKVKTEGGTVTANSSSITVSGANSATVILAIGSNFNAYNNVNGDEVARATSYIDNVSAKNYTQLLTAHLEDYQALFNRVDINLGPGNSSSSLPTDQRVANFNTSDDPQLVRLHYQFGRYLMIACSRPGSQPANLQGVWNKDMYPSWGSKYTTNINFQMNYWMTESGNLPECALPMIEKTKALVAPGQQSAQAHWGVNSGWVLHHNTDLWNRTGPIDGAWGHWPTGGAWLCYNLWEHYQFSKDKTYLNDVYPTFKSSAQFFLNSLVPEPISGNNYLVTSPSTSPELAHGGYYTCFGPTMDIQIIRDLFNTVIKSSEILNIDENFRNQVKASLARLPPHRVGRYGQLQEWFQDWDNPIEKHRHISHLYGLFPSNQISLRGTPVLANAAKVTLTQRGDDATGWSLAWKINFWARMEDGNHAYKLIRMLITPERTYNNLFDAHPPFQIDGNFGAVSGVNEMLMQSQNNEIQFLPALPTIWSNGYVKGLRARSGFLIDSISWKSGKLSQTTITSLQGDTLRLRYGNISRTYITRIGETYAFDGSLNLMGATNNTTPYNGIPHVIPGRIEAEEYDDGGEGFAYREANKNGNEGGVIFRNDEVDIESTMDEEGKYNIGYILNGEWLLYTVNVTKSGKYNLDLRVASPDDGKTLQVEMDGENITGPVSIPNTGGWQNWETTSVMDLDLTQGQHKMRILFNADYMNINYLEFKPSIVTSLGGEETETVQIFPNPFNSDGISIKLKGTFRYKVEDILGIQVESGSATDEGKIGAALGAGIYVLTLETHNGITMYKIVKR
ncbi:MAG: glycoside hydrolase N-terminal domain-containing protein [Sporocytophaga sp.]|nr:glycoside hydrolase N-terminal domain-containing protein [Sporocytophaga sp.]